MSEDAILTNGGDILGTLRGVLGDYFTYAGLSKKIDAESSRPWFVNDPAGNSYALGPNGALYVRGQTAVSAIGTQGTALLSQLLPLVLLVGGGLLLFRALK